MNVFQNNNVSAHQSQLRLWPGIIIVMIQWTLRFGIPIIVPNDIITQLGVFGGLLGGVAVIIWWAFFSKADRIERWGYIVLMILSLVVTSQFLDVSIKTGMMGLMFTIYSIPVLSLAFVLGLIISHRLSKRTRYAWMIVAIFLGSGLWTLLRTDGMNGSARNDFAWRWAKTAEERLLTQAGDESSAPVMAQTASKTEDEWPGFRGTHRDGIIYGTKLSADWSASQPAELWRYPIGPGCSSFAVDGNLFYTQEQRGENEVVSCYNLLTGKPVWKHADKSRFYDSHAGAGPRSTPTLANGNLYTLGATGILNALDASNGSVLWSCNAAVDNQVEVLLWGFTGSPLVIGDVVIVALSGKLAAYDIGNGKLRWSCADGGNSFSSPHQVLLDGVLQILLMSKSGIISVEPDSGKELWNYSWPLESRILQPAVIAGGDLLLTGEMNGIRRISVSHEQNKWAVKELWNSSEMMMNFNDFVVNKGFLYGFDGPRLACMNLQDGKLMWKGSPYRGWLLLLADQDLMLVLSEKGGIALVKATSGQFTELAKFKAIEGKTWNHPALAGNVLLVRNSLEMAAFRLPQTAN
jgi:outer membrane protein assembly factor BamB